MSLLSIPLIGIFIVLWFLPLIGGILSIFSILLFIFYYAPIGSVFNQNLLIGLLNIFACVLLLGGGILSIIMGIKQQKIIPGNYSAKPIKYRWLKWLLRILLFLACFLPYFIKVISYVINYKFTEYILFDVPLSFSIPFIIIIFIIAWFYPFLGGILSIIAIPIVFFIHIYFIAWQMNNSGPDPLIFLELALLLIGGIFLIIWGLKRRKEVD
jgi:hypothetical protein